MQTAVVKFLPIDFFQKQTELEKHRNAHTKVFLSVLEWQTWIIEIIQKNWNSF